MAVVPNTVVAAKSSNVALVIFIAVDLALTLLRNCDIWGTLNKGLFAIEQLFASRSTRRF